MLNTNIDTETVIKIKKPINLESVADYIFYCLIFLLPIFALPFTINALAFSKAALFYIAIGIAFLLWLIVRLQKGELKIPKSALLLSLAGIVLVRLASSIFSLNPKLSMIGAGYEIDTFFFFLFAGAGLFLASMLFQSEKKTVIFYSLLFISATAVFVFQLIHIVFGLNVFSGFFPFKTSNLVGGWNDLAVFFGFIALSAIIFFEMLNLSRRIKIMLFILIALSFIAMTAVNFFTIWYVLGIFILIFLVYYFSCQSFGASSSGISKINPGRKLINLSFFIIILIFLFILAKGILGDITVFLGTNIIDVRPSWSATYEVAYKTLSERPVLGSGPNTFLYDWLKFKPESINSTIFWNTRFQSGIGWLPSMVATSGILGGIAMIAFLVCLIYYGLKVISCNKNNLNRTLLAALFLGSLYLWTFAVFYSPGLLIFVLAFLVTGILIAGLVRAEKIKTIELSFLKNPKIGFISVLLTVFLILATVFAIYLFAQKYWAGYSYVQALKVLNMNGDLDRAESGISRAGRLDRQDIYFRDLSELGIARIQQILSQSGVAPEILRNQFQNALGSAIQNAQIAANLNPLDPLNWIQMGRIYESVAPLNISGAKDLAINSYNEALKRSPLDPSSYLAMARVEAQSDNIGKAREYIDSALGIKGDFAAALFFLSQIEAQQGNLKEAIQRNEQTVLIAPNDIGALFQLGLLYYQDKNYDGARFAFERTVALNTNYSNARYFLGLIYDKKGMKKEAIEQFEKIKELNLDNNEVKGILNNLNAGRGALEDISPPEEAPEKREKPPVE